MQMSKESFVLQSGLLPNPLSRALAKRVAKKAALLAVVAASCACAREPPINVDVTGQPVWVVDAFEKSADFWALHDIEVNIDRVSSEGSVAVEVVSGVDFTARWKPLENKILVSAERDPALIPEEFRNVAALQNAPTCALAHEIGHAIGMGHVEDPESLMFETAVLPNEGCWWSVDDQIELCRATGCIPEEKE